MIAIKNITKKNLEVAFEFYTYQLPAGKIVFVNEDLAEHLKAIMKSAFNFSPKLPKSGIRPVLAKNKKTTVYSQPVPMSDMKVTKSGVQTPTFGLPDLTPPSGVTDKDGVGWYGEGVQIEKGSGKAFR